MLGGLTIQISSLERLMIDAFFLIPGLWMAITLIHLYIINNREKNSTISLTGFYICWNIIHHLVFYINIIAYINSTISDIILFLILLFTELFALIAYPGLVPLMLHGDKIYNDVKPRTTSFMAYLILWIIGFVLICFILNSVVIYYILFNPTVYLILSNIYFINIALNIIGRSWVSDHPSSIVLKSLFIGIYPFTKLGPNLWVEGYNKAWLINYFIFQSIQIIIISLQWRYGSLFFLPGKCRKKTYDIYVKQLVGCEDSQNIRCNFWTNSLLDPELNYSDTIKSFGYSSFEKLTYFELPWTHKFHPNWILQKLDEKQSCPVWDFIVPKNMYLD